MVLLRHITAPSPAYTVHYYSAVYIGRLQRLRTILCSPIYPKRSSDHPMPSTCLVDSAWMNQLEHL